VSQGRVLLDVNNPVFLADFVLLQVDDLRQTVKTFGSSRSLPRLRQGPEGESSVAVGDGAGQIAPGTVTSLATGIDDAGEYRDDAGADRSPGSPGELAQDHPVP